jgi:uncharacterized protein YndB with AHSA1/START domain
MTVTAVRKDTEALTLTATTELDASADRVWQLWADPRQLERWWGPPTYPATFTAHDLRPGGQVAYYMTGPDGDQPHGYWVVVETDPPHSLLLRDGFADADGSPDPNFPISTMQVTIQEIDGKRTRMSIVSTFPDAEAMQKLLEMGMEQGLREAMGQIDAILAEDMAVKA